MNSKTVSSITDLIGNTPLVKLENIAPSGSAEIFVKLEGRNPGGSVKDRIVYGMISDAISSGRLKPHGVIVESTSGNTGSSIAMVGASLGYKVILSLPDGVQKEKITRLQMYGAQLIFTDASKGVQGAFEKAEQILANTPGAVLLDQFNNPANPETHRRTTGREILRALGGTTIDVFVAGVGTGGTLTGVGEVLKTKFGAVEIVAVEPEKSAVLSGGAPGPHNIFGLGAGFLPAVLNKDLITGVEAVSDDEALSMVRKLSIKEGLFVGPSSGAACVAAIRIAKRLGKSQKVVTVFPDGGESYLDMFNNCNRKTLGK